VVVVTMIDSTGSALYAALNGLTARQRVVANNVSNVATPGFIAGRVSFEDSLREAIAGGDGAAMSVSTRSATDPVNLNGNNVSLDNEVVALTETDLAYQLMIQALNSRFGLVRTARGVPDALPDVLDRLVGHRPVPHVDGRRLRQHGQPRHGPADRRRGVPGPLRGGHGRRQRPGGNGRRSRRRRCRARRRTPPPRAANSPSSWPWWPV
jgi:flagellar basal-body rod protein FlgB